MTANFIILTTQRSGSSWLSSLIDSHPDITMYGELFLDQPVPLEYQTLREKDPDRYFQFCKTSKSKRPKVTSEYLDMVFQHHEGVSGFKLMTAPFIKHPEIILYCNKRNIKVIHLTRDIEERVLSHTIAEQRNHFHNIKENIDIKRKIDLNYKIVARLHKKQKIYDSTVKMIMKTIKPPTLCIDYAQLHNKTEKTIKTIYEFLNVEYYKPQSEFKKVISKSHYEQIRNADEIRQIF